MEFKHRTKLHGLLAALVIAGCASTPPGRFATHYQQSTIVPSASVSSVTLLRLTAEAEQQMLAGKGVLVGTSQFETVAVDRAQIEAETKAQAGKIGANVVILHQRKVRADTRTREKTVKTDWQKALEANDPVSFEKGSSSSKTQGTSSASSSGTRTTETKTEHKRGRDWSSSRTQTNTSGSAESKGTAESKGKSSSFHVGGSAADFGRLLGGEKTVQEEYQVDIYEIRAVFVRDPTYPGLD